MKNVAKCDTWCELQKPVIHGVFERKLRPKPLGRGHVCLGVTHRCPNAERLVLDGAWGGSWPPGSRASRLGGKRGRGSGLPDGWGVGKARDQLWKSLLRSGSRNPHVFYYRTHNETSGQAGLPAEFKHINKRRKRN